MGLQETPSQTIGPFFAVESEHNMLWPDGPDVVAPGTQGECWVRGTVRDGDGEPVADALVETWQADHSGGFAFAGDPDAAPAGFRGFGRVPTGPDGSFAIRTVKPGATPGPGGTDQAPHIDVSLFARGLLRSLVTRVYFADESAANEADPVLALVEPALRDTLIAREVEDGYVFDIRLQGDDATVFFDV